MSEPHGIILTAVDGSQNSLVAAGVAARLAAQLNAHLGLIHVLDEPVVSFWGGLEARMKSEIRAEAEATLQRFADKVRALCQVTIPEFCIEDGLPEDVIPGIIAAQPGVIMLVVGRNGIDGERKSHLRTRPIGHVTAHLIEHVAVPVLAVPSQVSPSQICDAAAALGDANG